MDFTPRVASLVTLRVRVWIETAVSPPHPRVYLVTLRVRVWIETIVQEVSSVRVLSHPPREGVD